MPYEHEKKVNDAAVAAAEREGAGIVRGWPMHAVFEFTGACNLHCFMCGFEMLRDELRDQGRTKFTMPVEMFRLVVNAAFPHIRTVNPTLGGEPFLLPYFDEFLQEVERYGCKVEMYTNGTLMHGERLRRLMPHLVHLTVSIDGATKATFEHIRTGAKFETVMANVAEFARLRRELGLRSRIRYAFNVVLMRDNIDELAQIVEMAAANDVDMVTACFVIPTSPAIAALSPTLCPERTNAALRAATAAAARHGLRTEFPLPLPVDREPWGGAVAAVAPEVPVSAASADAVEPAASVAPAAETASGCAAAGCDERAVPSPSDPTVSGVGPPADYRGAYYCDMAWRKVFVGVGGEVMPCCSPTRPILGNAFEQPWEEIWNGAEYQRLRRGLFTGELTDYCRKCPYLQQTGALPYALDRS